MCFTRSAYASGKYGSCIIGYDCVWVEPISMDAALRDELRGWYHIKRRFVENEVGQRFYFDFYGAKWLAFANGPENI